MDGGAAGGFSHHVLREQWPCLSLYHHQLAAAHPLHDTWSGRVGSLPLPGAEARGGKSLAAFSPVLVHHAVTLGS